MTVRICHADADVSMAVFRNVQLTLFTGQMKMHHIPVVERIRADLFAAYPDGCFSLVTVSPGARLPTPETRVGAVRMINAFQASERGVGFVIEGSGVGVSALRTVVSAMILASRSTQPHKVFDQASLAVPWLAERSTKMGHPLTPTELGDAAYELRAHHMARNQAAAAAPA